MSVKPTFKLELEHHVAALINLLNTEAYNIDRNSLWEIAKHAGEIQRLARKEADRCA